MVKSFISLPKVPKSVKLPSPQGHTLPGGVEKPGILGRIMPKASWFRAFPANESHFHFNKRLAHASSYGKGVKAYE